MDKDKPRIKTRKNRINQSLEAIGMTRNCTCLRCGYKWIAKVAFSKWTQNLSMEKTNWCPKCDTKEVMSEPCMEEEVHKKGR